MYQPIEQVKNGIKLKMMLKAAGYDVKYIQEYLHLSCPHSLYRWFKGKVLPSVEHLCALSRLLNVHMEELLVLQGKQLYMIWWDYGIILRQRDFWHTRSIFRRRHKSIGLSVQ